MSQKRIVIFGYSGSIHIKKWATSLVKRGYAVRVISLGGDEIKGVDVIRLKRRGKLSYFLHASKAVKVALEFEPDLIHVHYAGGYGIWGVKTKFKALVVSVWGSDIEALPKSFFFRPFIRKILIKANKITATSEALKRSTISLYEKSNMKISVIPFGVLIPENTVELPETEFVSAIFVKHLEEVYAPDLLIKAVALVVEKYPNFRVTMCGAGSMKEQVLNSIQNLKLENSIHLAGYIENDKLYDLIRKHHFMVMPSRKEGFGVAAVEAFACSRPVVATNVGGIPEIITNGQNGYMVDPNNVQQLANAMMTLISDKEKIKQMGLNGYDTAKKNFDWEKSVDMMVEVYESF